MRDRLADRTVSLLSFRPTPGDWLSALILICFLQVLIVFFLLFILVS